jgi:hypothetical protein
VMLLLFVQHVLWRPRQRAWVFSAMRARDVQRIRRYVDEGKRSAASLGLDSGEIELPA